jgi:hypothetical protein
MRAFLCVAGVLAACGPRAPAPPISGTSVKTGGAPPLPGAGDRAYFGGDEALVEVAGDTGAHQTVVPTGVQWCEADARAAVVWFVNERGLSVFDLDDRKVHDIIHGDLANIEVIIDYDKARLGGTDAVRFRVGAKLTMTAAPALSLEMGCDGDAMYYCYEDDMTTPNADIARDQATVKALALADPAYVATLVARGARRPLWSPDPPLRKPPPPPTVDASQCTEDPTMCGGMIAVPQTPLWLVTVGNGRGDFYHEGRQLWDPATNEFIRVVDGKLVRARTANTESGSWDDYRGMRISPAGTMQHSGTVFTPRAVVFHTEGLPHDCGWANGGWRISS